MINPVFLKTFLSLANTKNFTKTAEILHMTQPGVSQHLKWLEDYFGQPLVIKEGKKFELTEQGKKVLEYGHKLFNEHRLFKEALSNDHPHEGLCRFASAGSFGIKMYDFLLSINCKFPKLIISFYCAPNHGIIRDLLEDRIDVGFVTKLPEDTTLSSEIIAEEKLQLMIPLKFSDLNFLGLTKLGFINHPDGHHHAARLLQENFPREFRGMDQFPLRGFINQIHRILDPVAYGLGFTALPEFACNASPRGSSTKIFPLKKIVKDPIYMIHKKNRNLPSRFDFIFSEYHSKKSTL
jgi:DNA-binding transcriptional LysR family regulator